MRKCCQNINIEKIIDHHKNKTKPICCERCNLLLEYLRPVEIDIDVNKLDIIITNDNQLKLVLSITSTVDNEITDIVNQVETLFVCVNINQNLSELMYNNSSTVMIDKFHTDLRKPLILELYNESYLTTKDIKFVISNLRNDSAIRAKNLEQYSTIDLKTKIGHYQALRILKDYKLTDFQIEMQKSISEEIYIN